MLPSEFDQVLNVLRDVLRNVQRLTNLRTPRWWRHVTPERQEKLRMNEIQEFKRAAAALMSVVNDAEMRQVPLPWSVLKRNVENIPLWLDRLANKPQAYEEYKIKLMSGLVAILNNEEEIAVNRAPQISATSIPATRNSTWRNAAASILFAGASLMAGLGYAPRAFAEDTKQTDVQTKPKKLPEYAKNLDDFLKQTGLSEDYVNTQMEKTPEKIIEDSKIKVVKYDEKTKTNNYEELLKNGCGKYVVLFGSFKRDDKTSELTKRSLIQAEVMARLLDGFVEVVYFDMDVDPALVEKNYTPFKEKLEVLGMPTMQLSRYDSKLKQLSREDSKQGGPGSSKGALASIYNGIVNWALPVFFGTETDDGKKYKYQNTGKLQEIAQK